MELSNLFRVCSLEGKGRIPVQSKEKKMRKMTWLLAMVFAVGLFSKVVFADEGAPGMAATPVAPVKQVHKKTKAKKTSAEVWVCPMGDYKGPKTADGKCPTCKMDLEKFVPKKDKGAVKEGAAKPSAAAPEAQRVAWTCPMCGGSYDKAGKCPDCGMALVPKK